MRLFAIALLIAGLAAGTPVNEYGGTKSGYEDKSGYSSSTDYETKCTPHYESEIQEKCEPYTEKVCYTTQQESCTDIDDKICRGIVTGKQYRKCFNVTEMLCALKEEIRYDVVQAVFTVQKCHKVSERVCDTVYEPHFTNRNDFQCIMIKTPNCYAEEKTVTDKTCRTTTKFDCSSYHNSHGYGSGSTAVAGDSYGSTGSSYGQESYGSTGGSYGQESYGSTGGSYGQESYGSTGSSYGQESYDNSYNDPVCKRTLDTKCYTTPRAVTSQVCEHREEKVCEKMNEKTPIPAEKQRCHDEEKKVCELEQRQQPKQIKKYVYTKQCKSVPRRVCENADAKHLVPSCVPTTRKHCHYTPVEKCEELPKQHCYKFTRRIKKEKCETFPKKSAYPVESSYSSGGSTDAYSSGDDYSK